MWALDFIFDATSDGRPIKALSMCDEFTRENLARRLGRSITADDVTHALDDACAVRGAPEHIRMDNGPEFVALVIRDWCRVHGTGTSCIDPGSPWQNPYVASFNGKVRDELFSREVFDTIMVARLLFDDWCDTYNRYRPHSALGYLPPAVFAAAFNKLDQLGLPLVLVVASVAGVGPLVEDPPTAVRTPPRFMSHFSEWVAALALRGSSRGDRVNDLLELECLTPPIGAG